MSTKKFLANQLVNAVIHNDVVKVRHLLDQGADPTVTLDHARITVLHYAAQNNSLEVVPLLVDAGADISAQTEPEGQTAITTALAHGHEKIAKLLLAYLNFGLGKIN